MKILFSLVFAVLSWQRALPLNNGLALTPPMGWLTWERFRCNTDCNNDPSNCISEKLIKEMADWLVHDGYRDVGYKYVIIDDCWLAPSRDASGRLQPDPKRFPSGIKKLADYIHSKELKFGIYEDFGKKTCGGFPGSEFYMQTDAKTFADWGVDYVKFDGCYSELGDFAAGYETMGFFLNQTGRPMVYSCEWPFYKIVSKQSVNMTAVRNTCNLWRTYYDVQDSWDSVVGIIKFCGNDTLNISSFAGPGGWNDPDMLILGNFGLSYDQERAQIAMWAIMAAPLIMSNDLRSMRNSSKQLLQNRNIIAINQDTLGIQGKLIWQKNNIQLWKRPLSNERNVLGILNTNVDGTPRTVTIVMKDIGLEYKMYNVTEAFQMTHSFVVHGENPFKVSVNPNGIQMFILTPLHQR